MKTIKRIFIIFFAVFVGLFLFWFIPKAGLLYRSFQGDKTASSDLWEAFGDDDNKLLFNYFLRRAADQGDVNSNYAFFMEDSEKKAISKESIHKLKYAASHGHPSAMFELGSALVEGRFVAHDEKQGRLLIAQSACNGALQGEEPTIKWLMSLKTLHSMQLAYSWVLRLNDEAQKGSETYKDAQSFQKQIENWCTEHGINWDKVRHRGIGQYKDGTYCNSNAYLKLFQANDGSSGNTLPIIQFPTRPVER